MKYNTIVEFAAQASAVAVRKLAVQQNLIIIREAKMKVLKFLIVAVFLLSVSIISGCGSNADKFSGTWYGINGESIEKIIIEKHDQTYLLSFRNWYYESNILFIKQTNAPVIMTLTDGLFPSNKIPVTVKGDILLRDNFSPVGPLTYKDGKLTGILFPGKVVRDKQETTYIKAENVSVDELIKKIQQLILDDAKKQGIDTNRYQFVNPPEIKIENKK